jgi:hypothetical protein
MPKARDGTPRCGKCRDSVSRDPKPTAQVVNLADARPADTIGTLNLMRKYVAENGPTKAAGYTLALASVLPPAELQELVNLLFARERLEAPLDIDQPDAAAYVASIQPETWQAMAFFLASALPAPQRHRLIIEIVLRQAFRAAEAA